MDFVNALAETWPRRAPLRRAFAEVAQEHLDDVYRYHGRDTDGVVRMYARCDTCGVQHELQTGVQLVDSDGQHEQNVPDRSAPPDPSRSDPVRGWAERSLGPLSAALHDQPVHAAPGRVQSPDGGDSDVPVVPGGASVPPVVVAVVWGTVASGSVTQMATAAL